MIFIVLLFIWLSGFAAGVATAWLLGCSFGAAHPRTPDWEHEHDTRAFGEGVSRES